jgi:hypothetical protein
MYAYAFAHSQHTAQYDTVSIPYVINTVRYRTVREKIRCCAVRYGIVEINQNNKTNQITCKSSIYSSGFVACANYLFNRFRTAFRVRNANPLYASVLGFLRLFNLSFFACRRLLTCGPVRSYRALFLIALICIIRLIS